MKKINDTITTKNIKYKKMISIQESDFTED